MDIFFRNVNLYFDCVWNQPSKRRDIVTKPVNNVVFNVLLDSEQHILHFRDAHGDILCHKLTNSLPQLVSKRFPDIHGDSDQFINANDFGYRYCVAIPDTLAHSLNKLRLQL